MGQQQDWVRWVVLHRLGVRRRSARVVGFVIAATLLLGGGAVGLAQQALPQEPQTKLAQTPPAVEPFLVMGRLDENSDVLDDGTYFNAYEFDGIAGQTIAIDLISDDFDAYLILYDPDDNLIAEDDDGGDGSNARIVITLPITGSYLVYVNAYDVGETGDYQFQAQPASAENVEYLEKLSEATRLNRAGIDHYEAGQYEEAEAHYLQSLAILEQALPENHPDIAISLNNLARLYESQGNYGEVEPLLQRALSIQETVFGETHPAVANSLNNLALLHKVQGNYGAAEPLYLRALSILEAVFGEPHPYIAASLNNLASLYQAQGNYGAAEPLYQRALSIQETVFGQTHPDVATSLNNLAGLYQAQGNYGAAEPLYQRALSIDATVFGETHPDVATSLNNLAALYIVQGNYGAAEPLLQRVLSIDEMVLGKTHPDVAVSLNNLAALYQAQSNYGAAEPLYQRALLIQETVLGKTHPDVAVSLKGLAELYASQGNYGAAESLFKRALLIRETALGETHPAVAVSLNGLAGLYQAQGNYGAAESLFKRALLIQKTVLGETHPAVAVSLNGLAGLYQAQGNYGAAEPLYQRALLIQETVLGETHPDVAVSLNNLALLYKVQGNYGSTEALLQRALLIQETVFEEIHPAIANSLNRLAALYQAQGNHVAAEPLFKRALLIREAVFGETHPDIANSLNNLAAIYRFQGNYVESEPLYQRALSIRETVFGETHPDVAQSLNGLAEFYRDQGNYGAAEPLYQRALSIRETVFGETHPDVATSLNNLALLYQAQGNYIAAEPLFQRALSVNETSLGEAHPTVANSLNNLALFYYDQGNIPRSVEFLSRGTDIEETNISLNLAIGSESRKQAYIATLYGTAYATLSLHLQSAPTNPDAGRLALTTLLRRKGRVLDALISNQQLLRQNLSPTLAPLLDEYIAAQSQLATRLYGGLGEQDPAVYRAEVDALIEHVEQIENDLSRRSTEFQVATEPVEIEAVQAAIPTDAALVEIVQYRLFNPGATPSDRWGKPRYAAYILHPSGDLQWADLGDAATIDAAAFAFLSAARRPNSGNLARTAARELDQLVMAPIRPLLGKATHLLLSPDSQLNLIPFAALVDEQDRYLVETYTLTHLTSGRDLLRLQNPAPSRQPPVILANPDYDSADGSGAALVANALTSSRPEGDVLGVRAATQRSGDIAELSFDPLSGTALEAEAIAPLLNDAIVLTEAEATENALKQVQSPSILHIATHGFFLEDGEFVPPPDAARGNTANIQPIYIGDETAPPRRDRPINNENPLLRSGLALAGFNTRDSAGEDGVFTALEAASLDLRGTRLVVMSACDTGRGEVANGEGVYGLRRAFVMAGAESQLMSLWKVDDAATAELMGLYYERLAKGEGRSEAMRQVQLELMTSAARPHPFYWAAFIFSGQWSPIDDL